MNRNRNDIRRGGGNIKRGNSNGGSNSGYLAAGALAAGAAVIGGVSYWFIKGRQTGTTQQINTPEAQTHVNNQPEASAQRPAQAQEDSVSISSYLTNLISRMSSPQSVSDGAGCDPPVVVFRRSPPPSNPCLSNLNALLSDIYVRYVQIRDDDFQLHYRVFDRVFHHLHQMMKEVDPYYRKYSSTVQFAGSHYDNLRIKKPDEFDMDIVIDLPLNLNQHPSNPAESDIFIEPNSAGYIQLKMGVQFQKLPMRDGVEWQNNKAAYDWMDKSNYLLRSKFLDWFRSVVDKALNRFELNNLCPSFFVDGIPYAIKKSESGPAVTLIILNQSRGFKLDVDLVPALKFPESRWPVGPRYRPVPAGCSRGAWLAVGKAPRAPAPALRRCWRVALHYQERELMHDSGNLRQAVRLLKKLRDSLGMKKIASYYIKTLFFWEIVERSSDVNFWQRNNPAFLFKLMVGKLHAALVSKKIPYFWNKDNNLIGCVEERVLFEYAAKLVPLIQVLEKPSEYKQVARYLLTNDEFREYNAKFLHI